jgi:membrane protein YqaA with SNARE-associated domain
MGDLISQLQAHTAGNPFGVFLVTYVVALVSGFLPLINCEAYLVSVSALSPLAFVFPLTLAAALGQMSAKVVLYLSGRGVMHLPLGRYRAKLDAVHARFEHRRSRASLFLFGSAATGFPPFYVVAVLAGMLRLSFTSFVIAGTLGRFVRFGVVVIVPQLVRHWS